MTPNSHPDPQPSNSQPSNPPHPDLPHPDSQAANLRLGLSAPYTAYGLSYQILTIDLTNGDRLIAPSDLTDLALPPGIDTRGGVVISGRAPIWLYGYLIHELHPTAWVACYDPRIGAVVVATHSRQTTIGQVLPIDIHSGTAKPRLCPALMLVGPPDSGKSVLSHALFTALLADHPNIFLQRANWDGEGNWILELGDDATEDDREAFKQVNKGIPPGSERFFPHHADAILNLRQQKQLVIVDVGGMVQDTKMPVLEACSHYLVISSKPEKDAEWHKFCGDRGNLKCVAVVHSFSQSVMRETVHQWEPYVEMSLPTDWVTQRPLTVPAPLLQQVTALVSSV